MKKEFFQNNRKALLSLIENDSIVVLHSGYASFKTADQMFPYVVNRNFYYNERELF